MAEFISRICGARGIACSKPRTSISKLPGLQKFPREIYHLKAAGESNWNKLDALIKKIETARAEGLRITADMYTYTAGATGLDACMPPWVQEGGYDEWARRLQRSCHPRAREARDVPTGGRLGELLRGCRLS